MPDKSINPTHSTETAITSPYIDRNQYYNYDCMATYTGTPYYLLNNEGGTGITSKETLEMTI